MSKPQQTCIFCGNTGMSKEHIWGKWLKDYVRQDLLKHGMFTQVVNRPGTPNTEHLHIKSGDPLQSKVRVVCTKCNNECLSAIQDRAKPHLIPLFTGTTRVLGVEAQEILATWITMATMTAEHLISDPRQRAISQTDREYLWRNSKPPTEWRILIGRYQRHRLATQWTHCDIPVLETKDVPPAGVPPQSNMQITTFMIGELFAHAMSTQFPNQVRDWDFRTWPRARVLLSQVWPIEETAMVWPTQTMSMTDLDAFNIGRAYFNWLNGIARLHGF
jgi:hypothetical protein